MGYICMLVIKVKVRKCIRFLQIKACEIAEKESIDLEYIDIGGGFLGIR